jgi:adenylate cyclase
LLAEGVFDSPDEQKNFEPLLKSYQKLFRTARRLMRIGDHNERQLNAAAEVIAQKNKELESLSTKLSKYLSPQIYNSIFTGAQGVEIASNRKKLTIFFSDVVNFTETIDKLESEDPATRCRASTTTSPRGNRDPRGAGGVQVPPQPAKARQERCDPNP